MSGAEILAIDIGGTTIGWAVTDANNITFDGSEAIATNARAGGADVVQRIAALVRDIAATHSLLGIGIASAGVVDPATGDIVSATNTMPGWAGTRLGTIVADAVGVPVHVINDVHAHGLGESVYGAGRGYESVLSVAVGTGIGGALIRGGQIDFGERFLAGHYGHVHHHLADELTCSCGRRGHIEAISSGHGITNWFNTRRTPADPEVANGKELEELAESGNSLARRVLRESAVALGETLASLANSIDPGVLVLSGSMTRSGPTWWEGLRSGYAARAMDPVADMPITLGELGSAAPLYGAAVNFLRQTSNAAD